MLAADKLWILGVGQWRLIIDHRPCENNTEARIRVHRRRRTAESPRSFGLGAGGSAIAVLLLLLFEAVAVDLECTANLKWLALP